MRQRHATTRGLSLRLADLAPPSTEGWSARQEAEIWTLAATIDARLRAEARRGVLRRPLVAATGGLVPILVLIPVMT